MAMSKKHYEQIASALGNFQVEMNKREQENFDTLVGNLCQIFAKDNPNFISWRFITKVNLVMQDLADGED